MQYTKAIFTAAHEFSDTSLLTTSSSPIHRSYRKRGSRMTAKQHTIASSTPSTELTPDGIITIPIVVPQPVSSRARALTFPSADITLPPIPIPTHSLDLPPEMSSVVMVSTNGTQKLNINAGALLGFVNPNL